MKTVRKNRLQNRSLRYRREERLAITLISFALIYLIVTMVVPLIWAFVVSFTDKKIGGTPQFNGLANYAEVLKGKLFWKSAYNTVVYTVSSVSLKVILGMILALILNEPLKGKNVWRALLLLPWTIPNVVATLTWRWMLSDVGGVFNHLLQSLHLIDAPVGWIATPGAAMFSVILVNVWKGMPFLALTIYAGLQTIPGDLYEAARIDGSSAFQRFLYITLPNVKSVLLLGTLVTTIWTLNNFESVWLMTGGGPVNATQLLSTLSYTFAFKFGNIGKAITVSVLSFPLILMLVRAATKHTLDNNN